MSIVATVTNAAAEIAAEAIDQLHGAIQTIHELEALFRVIRKESLEYSDVRRLSGIGEYNAADNGNSFDCERESLLEKLKVATQNANTEIVSRTSSEAPA